MAGDWIKVENVTPNKPEVFAISDHLGIDADAVLGKLIRIWIWADEQTQDGCALRVTRSSLDRITGHIGFAEAMLQCGWLVSEGSDLKFPNFNNHNGQTSKTRALAAKRMCKHRSVDNGKTSFPLLNGYAASATSAQPEKRREDELHTGNGNGTFLTNQRSEAFNRFIQIYPRPESPEAAWKAWRGTVHELVMRDSLPDAAIEERIIEAATAYAASPAGQSSGGGTDYRPAPAKWISGHKFDEPRELWQQPNKKPDRKKKTSKPNGDASAVADYFAKRGLGDVEK